MKDGLIAQGFLDMLGRSLQRSIMMEWEHRDQPHKRGEVKKCWFCRQERIADTDADDWDYQP